MFETSHPIVKTISLNTPQSSKITKGKVKLALINFLLCHHFQTKKETVAEDIEVIKQYALSKAKASKFKNQIKKAKVDFTLEQCADELFDLLAVFVEEFELNGLYYPYIDTGYDKGWLINESYLDEMIYEMEDDQCPVEIDFEYGYCDLPWVGRWVGSSTSVFSVEGEDFRIAFRDGRLDERVINDNNDCNMQYDCLMYDRNNTGSIHFCAVAAISWLMIDNFNIKCQKSMIELASTDVNAVEKSKKISDLLGEEDTQDYTVAAYEVLHREGWQQQADNIENYLIREAVIPIKKLDKMPEIVAILQE